MTQRSDNLSIFGKSFDDLDERDGISKKPLAVENQIVTDEKGRRRFHGAFTGGFSAGYFNTVGSIEGWTPSTFKSGRNLKKSVQEKDEETFKYKKPEDFMDKEDLGDYGIAPRQVRTTSKFSEADEPRESRKHGRLAWEHTELAMEADRLAQFVKPVEDSIGVLLLKKMGWRPGKGIGPLISKHRENENFTPENFKFAPEDINLHIFDAKSDLHGLGYKGLDLERHFKSGSFIKESALKINQKQKKGIQGQAFGVGAFEEDDEDIYGLDDLTKYDFALESTVSRSKDDQVKETIDDDFTPAENLLAPRKFFLGPKIGRDFQAKCPFAGDSKKNSKIATTSEEQRSVWSYVSPADRRRLQLKENEVKKEEKTKIFEKDEQKNERFENFMNYIKRGLHPPKPSQLTDWEWDEEKLEFERAAPEKYQNLILELNQARNLPFFESKISKSAQKVIKNRFTKGQTDDDQEETRKEMGQNDLDKLKAVEMKMFGPMTREKHEWHPEKNLCKRWDVPNPYPQSEISGVPHLQKKSIFSSTSKKSTSDQIFGSNFSTTVDELEFSRPKIEPKNANLHRENVEFEENLSENEPRNEFLEKDKPPMDLFEEIFGGSAEEESEEEEEVENEPTTSKGVIEKLKHKEEGMDKTTTTLLDDDVIAVLGSERLKPKEDAFKKIEEPKIYGPTAPPPFDDDVAILDEKVPESSKSKRHHKNKSHKKKHKKQKKKKNRKNSSSDYDSSSSSSSYTSR